MSRDDIKKALHDIGEHFGIPDIKEENDDAVDFFGVKLDRDTFNSFVESWLNLNEKKNGEDQ